MKDATFHLHLYSYAKKRRRVHGPYTYGLEEARLYRRMIAFMGRKGPRLPKVINQFERRRVQPGKARWRSKAPPSVAVKHSNGARPIGPLDGSGSRSKEKKPADGRHEARIRISPGLPTIPVSYPEMDPAAGQEYTRNCGSVVPGWLPSEDLNCRQIS
jgi:hypothetical protein